MADCPKAHLGFCLLILTHFKTMVTLKRNNDQQPIVRSTTHLCNWKSFNLMLTQAKNYWTSWCKIICFWFVCLFAVKTESFTWGFVGTFFYFYFFLTVVAFQWEIYDQLHNNMFICTGDLICIVIFWDLFLSFFFTVTLTLLLSNGKKLAHI